MKSLLIGVIAALALMPAAARAESITFRNKLVNAPGTLWVAEYRENIWTGVATLHAGPWRVEANSGRTWEKSDANGPYRWVRWGREPDDDPMNADPDHFPDTFDKDTWNGIGWKFKISNGVLTCNIVDNLFDTTKVRAKTDTGLATAGIVSVVGDFWEEVWASTWDALSPGGNPLTLHNHTETTLWAAEYKQKPLGTSKRFGDDPVEIPPGESVTITKGYLTPGFTTRWLYFKDTNGDFADERDYLKRLEIFAKGRSRYCGAGVGQLHLYVDKSGEPKAYYESEWVFKSRVKCKVINALANAAASVGEASLSDTAGKLLGVDALLAPVEAAVADVLAEAIPEDFQQVVSDLAEAAFPEAAVTALEDARTTLAAHEDAILDLFKTNCFCKDNPQGAGSIREALEGFGLRVDPSWMGDPSGFHQAFTASTVFSYKQYEITLSQKVVTDWGSHTMAYHGFALGVSTGAGSSAPSATRVLSVEFLPDYELPTDNDYGWAFGVSGDLPEPLSGGADVLFDADPANGLMPTLSSLEGVALSADLGGGGSGGFQYTGGFEVSWPVWEP